MIKKAKIFQNGGSQAVRLPTEFRFDSDEVVVEKVGNMVILKPVNYESVDFFDDSEGAPDDFMNDRDDELPQERSAL